MQVLRSLDLQHDPWLKKRVKFSHRDPAPGRLVFEKQYSLIHEATSMSHVMSKPGFVKTKVQISCAVTVCAVTVQLISTFIFAFQILQSLFFLKLQTVAVQVGFCEAW